MPMTDPVALAVAFSGNIEAKKINIHRRYSGYLISKKIYKFQSLSLVFYQQSFLS